MWRVHTCLQELLCVECVVSAGICAHLYVGRTWVSVYGMHMCVCVFSMFVESTHVFACAARL